MVSKKRGGGMEGGEGVNEKERLERRSIIFYFFARISACYLLSIYTDRVRPFRPPSLKSRCLFTPSPSY
jgi:hypothetical protein